LVESGGEDDLRQGARFLAGGCLKLLLVHEALNHGESIQAGHLDVEEDQVGMVLLNQVNGLDTSRASCSSSMMSAEMDMKAEARL
jgi:hypothetical protein